MQNEERKRSKFFEFNQCYKQKINNTFSHELQRQNDIECYDKVMESHPNYSNIVYTFVRKFIRGRIKIFTVPKAKSMLKNINHRMIFVILL
jgi:hypothetical protein